MKIHHWPIALLAGLAISVPEVAQAGRLLGDSRVFAELPNEPGFPEDVALLGDRVFISGPAQSNLFVQPSILEYDLNSGALVRKYDITGQNPSLPQAIAGIVFDNQNRLYVSDIQQGIVRFDVTQSNPVQEIYATALPDLPICSAVAGGTTCSPNAVDLPPLINDIIFDAKGDLYISDSFQSTIWRVAAGGGTPEIWYQDSRFDGFGANGVRIDPTGTKLYVAATADAVGQGFIYTLPLVDAPSTTDISTFFQYAPGEAPAGIEFGASGNLYVVLGRGNQISVLSPNGTETNRFSGPAIRPDDPNNPLLWRNPSNIAFNNKDRSLLVTNNPLPTIFEPQPEFAVYDVFVDDVAVGVEVPEPSSMLGMGLFLALGWRFGHRRIRRYTPKD
ncbi:SMP-30/gluconolactonase/LRE family protein [Nostoc sp. TCL26-01]|uniref:SMP-30/gluconolactonase/LRE family protein n=1 Tax=Nostoc sp. TCL26-01 TaxID=2576904 RepID=UPI0015B9CB20|nr:PEP-CTERM sorting domain-containing protein [Nostoc sp. TCL26-01]QLE58175.1 PEP-CTERM sorting domain-containing protein [Nostoc sp. TCL26-01]